VKDLRDAKTLDNVYKEIKRLTPDLSEKDSHVFISSNLGTIIYGDPQTAAYGAFFSLTVIFENCIKQGVITRKDAILEVDKLTNKMITALTSGELSDRKAEISEVQLR